MAFTLESKVLPEDVDWIDEFSGWSPIQRETTLGSTGRNIHQSGALIAGRPITLASESLGEVAGVTTRADVLEIQEMLLITTPMLLTLDDRQFNVAWADENPFTATPLTRYSDPALTDKYKIVLKFITIEVSQ